SRKTNFMDGYTIGFVLLAVFAVGLAAVSFWQKNLALAISAIIAGGLHAGVLVIPAPEVEEVEAPVVEEPIQIVEMPPLEPEEEIEIVESEDVEAPPEFAPPMLMDLPSTVP